MLRMSLLTSRARPGARLRTICMYCARQIKAGPAAPISHGICPECYAQVMRELDQQEAIARCQVLR